MLTKTTNSNGRKTADYEPVLDRMGHDSALLSLVIEARLECGEWAEEESLHELMDQLVVATGVLNELIAEHGPKTTVRTLMNRLKRRATKMD